MTSTSTSKASPRRAQIKALAACGKAVTKRQRERATFYLHSATRSVRPASAEGRGDPVLYLEAKYARKGKPDASHDEHEDDRLVRTTRRAPSACRR